jgi:hypothetical protein
MGQAWTARRQSIIFFPFLKGFKGKPNLLQDILRQIAQTQFLDGDISGRKIIDVLMMIPQKVMLFQRPPGFTLFKKAGKLIFYALKISFQQFNPGLFIHNRRFT